MSATFFSSPQRIPSVLSVGNGGGGSSPEVIYNYLGNQDITLTNETPVAYSDSLPGWDDAAVLAAIAAGNTVEIVSQLVLSADTGPTQLYLDAGFTPSINISAGGTVACSPQTTGTGAFGIYTKMQIKRTGANVNLLSYESTIDYCELKDVPPILLNAYGNGTSELFSAATGKLYVNNSVAMNSVDLITLFIKQVRVTIL